MQEIEDYKNRIKQLEEVLINKQAHVAIWGGGERDNVFEKTPILHLVQLSKEEEAPVRKLIITIIKSYKKQIIKLESCSKNQKTEDGK